jgi:CDP-glucose 4,6-dehydratase
MIELWGVGGFDIDGAAHVPEANLLKLDCSKARAQLGWRPALDLAGTLQRIVDWHRSVADGSDARSVTCNQLNEYRALMDQRRAGETLQ